MFIIREVSIYMNISYELKKKNTTQLIKNPRKL